MSYINRYNFKIFRIGIALVFLYFGYINITSPESFSGLVPDWVTFIAEAEKLVQIHGIVEIVLGLMLAFGYYTRLVATLLLLNLLHITYLVGILSASGVRDLGICFALFYIATKKDWGN